MQPRTVIGIVSGFAALFTSTLGGTALACTDPSASAGVARAADSASVLHFGVEPVMGAARLSSYASFERDALDALTAKAIDLAGAISTAQAKGAPAKLVTAASTTRSAALAHLAEAKASLATVDSALSDGSNDAAATQLRLTAWHLHAAAVKLGTTRMIVGAAFHAAFMASKTARIADAKASLVSTDLKSFDADPAEFGHHCDGHFDAHFGDGQWGDGSWSGDSRWDQHDRYHHDWHH